MSSHEQIREFLLSPDWTDDEKEVIYWQFRLCGGFKSALWAAICRADDQNMIKLEMGFPKEVSGYRKWTRSDLAQRLRQAGLDI